MVVRLFPAALAFCLACYIELDPAQEGFRCNSGRQCEHGLVCRGNLCVREQGSVLACDDVNGQTCDSDQICTGGVLSTRDNDACCPGLCVSRCPDPLPGEAADGCQADEHKLVVVAPRAMQPPSIDGDPREWLATARIPMTRWNPKQTTASPQDLSAAFSVRWDRDGLYIFIDVQDDQWVAANGPEIWHDDIAEVFLDMQLPGSPRPEAPLDPSQGYDFTEAHFLVQQDGTVIEPAGPTRRGWPTSGAYRHLRDGEWLVELGIRWPEEFEPPIAGDLLGFDVAVDDDDDDDTPDNMERESQLLWSGETNELYMNASHFGFLRLSSAPAL